MRIFRQNAAIPPCTYALWGGIALSLATALFAAASVMMHDNATYTGHNFTARMLAEFTLICVGIVIAFAYIYLCGKALVSALSHTGPERTIFYVGKLIAALCATQLLDDYVSPLFTAYTYSTTSTFGHIVQLAWLFTLTSVITAFYTGMITAGAQLGYSFYVTKQLELH